MNITLSQVSYTYQQHTPYEYQALKDVSGTFESGKFYAIVGKTGSGKSTLIQQLNGLLKPTSGYIMLGDLKVTAKTKDKYIKPYRKHIGMVFQFPESQLFEDTVEHEVLFGPKNFGMNLENARKKSKHLLRTLGFSTDVMEKSPFQLSGGQMRKVAIASVLSSDPDVIILDEPTAGLDPKSQYQLMTFFKQLQLEQQKTIIFVSHEMNLVSQYADEIKVMQGGTLVKSCTPRELFKHPEEVQKLHLDLPDVVKLQYDIEAKYHMNFPDIALTEKAFVDMYNDWRRSHER